MRMTSQHVISGRKINLTCDYSLLNGLAVRWFGTSEFYMSIFKIFLMLGLITYTFVTMVGGNPRGDAYGFRYWNKPVRDRVSFDAMILAADHVLIAGRIRRVSSSR
jgi:amino acid permease